MTSIFSVLPLESVSKLRRPYLDPRYPEQKYTEQRSFSDGQVRRRTAVADERTLGQALDSFQMNAALHNRYLQFTVHEEANLVQVIVKESNDEEKIIRKIPPDEIVRLIERRNEILGFLFDMVA